MSGISGGVPRGLPAVGHRGSGSVVRVGRSAVRVGRSAVRVGRSAVRVGRKLREEATLSSHLHTGRVGVLDPTPPTTKLEKDVEGVSEEEK